MEKRTDSAECPCNFPDPVTQEIFRPRVVAGRKPHVLNILGLSRRPQDTGENVIVTLKISKEKVIYGVLDGVNNPTNSCGGGLGR